MSTKGMNHWIEDRNQSRDHGPRKPNQDTRTKHYRDEHLEQITRSTNEVPHHGNWEYTTAGTTEANEPTTVGNTEHNKTTKPLIRAAADERATILNKLGQTRGDTPELPDNKEAINLGQTTQINELQYQNESEPPYRLLQVSFVKSVLDSWKSAIPGGEKLKENNLICEKHFNNEDVVKEFVQIFPDGTKQTLQRKKAALRKGAVPCIFPDRLQLAEVADTIADHVQRNSQQQIAPCEYSSENARSIDEANKKMLKARRSISDINSLVSCKRKAHQLETDEGTSRNGREIDEIQCATVSSRESQSLVNAENEETESTTVSLRENHFVEICNSLMHNAQSVTLPGNWIPQVICTGVKCIMFAEWKENCSALLHESEQ
ncbi:uncharacterized protein LOC116418366 [Nasonia vitripennis]|uniref:THAP-type domain-containing protein n=1 Tax=Nasonia vitripennis TaxID=7425 RepID=A0A7M7R271_NASVI|nr:uncharacterized protein LOC116418366 [Nasonia vitripennis]